MEESDSHTDSLRTEQGERENAGRTDRRATPMSLGSMIRGPIGDEGANDEVNTASDGANVDAKAAEEGDE